MATPGAAPLRIHSAMSMFWVFATFCEKFVPVVDYLRRDFSYHITVHRALLR
jgi:hypothetical protein